MYSDDFFSNPFLRGSHKLQINKGAEKASETMD